MGVRFLALRALCELEKKRGYSPYILNGILDHNPVEPADRGLLTHLFYGVLQRRGTLDWIIDTLSRRGIKKIHPLLVNILRLGCYQILYLERVPSYAAIHETVALTYKVKKREWASFVNAILRRLDGEGMDLPKGDNAWDVGVRYSHPPWIVDLLFTRYTLEETKSLLSMNNSIPPLSIRVNTLLITRKALLEKLKDEGIRAKPFPGLPDAILVDGLPSVRTLPSFFEGNFYIQGLGAMVAAHLLGGKKGEEILDLCGAPGGKATHLAQITFKEASILALDIHQHGIEKIRENCQRLQIESVKGILCNAFDFHPSRLFDRVLVDAPCSDLGLLARRPEIRWFRKPEDLDSLVSLQRRLLNKGASLLKSKGLLLYSTCTLTSKENEDVVEDFLRVNRGFCLLNGEKILNERGISFIPPHNKKGMLQYLPDKHGSEGFFLALMEKM